MSKKRTNWLLGLILGIIIIGIGIFFLLQTEKVMNAIVILVGALAVISGVRTLLSLSSYQGNKSPYTSAIIKSILNIIVGVVAVIMTFSRAASSWLEILLYALAVDMAISGLMSVWNAVQFRRAGLPALPLIWEAAVCLLVSVLLFLYPHFFARFAGLVIGLVIIVIGLVRVLVSLSVRSSLRATQENNVTEGDFEVRS
ncbi:DUF308 domain-containing protein [Parasphaerochaeta coccoides]|uniref:DUF308 domain-containing protein n=1 Tax=Parasphaerochaeta coccoides (strain ATCC BAA-1237 / DSM 17374 / SPN1) TaxID=760011 RepID=F4GI34_PARC1|nr:DUF308 domain-containing protein [Parasphaerochaeta coccoides]AEC02632.1 hypothetical protein Spico_1428 [Parasphaerochaeta coccoides DSM 17374]